MPLLLEPSLFGEPGAHAAMVSLSHWSWLVDPRIGFWRGLRACSGFAPCVFRDGMLRHAWDHDMPWSHVAIENLVPLALLS